MSPDTQDTLLDAALIRNMIIYDKTPSPPAESAHQRLPAEVLACIFTLCMPDLVPVPPPAGMSMAPWSVTHVCQRWRQVALCESSLWASIGVYDTRKPGGDGGEGTISALRAALHRSCSAPVDLSITSVASRGQRAQTFLDRHFAQLLAAHGHRLSELSLDFTHYSWDLDWIRTFFELPPGMFGALEAVAFNSVKRPIDGFTLDCAPRLRKLFVSRTSAPRAFVPGALGPAAAAAAATAREFPTGLFLPWSQLTHLELIDLPILPPIAYTLLKQCPLLVACTFSLECAPPVLALPASRRPIMLASLHSLDLALANAPDSTHALSTLSTFLRELALPALHDLSLDAHHTMTPLALTQTTTAHDPIALLLLTSRPSLEQLSLWNIRTDLGNIFDVAPTIVFCAARRAVLRRQTIRAMARRAAAFVPLLAYLECTVTLHDANEFVDMLAVRWSDLNSDLNSDQQQPCLKTVFLQVEDASYDDRLEVSNRIGAIVEEMGLQSQIKVEVYDMFFDL